MSTANNLSTRELVQVTANCSHIITEGEQNPNYRAAVLEAAAAARIVISRLGAEPPTKNAVTRQGNALLRKSMSRCVALAASLP